MVDSSGGTFPAKETEAFRSPSQGGSPQRSWPKDESKVPGRTGQGRDDAGAWGETAADKGNELVEEGKSLGKRVKDTAKDWAQTATEKTKAWAQSAGETAKDLAHTAGEKVDSARTSVGEGLESFGSGVREKGSSASAMVGEKLEAAGHYLREHDFSGMADSMKDVVRRHPVQSVFVGIGLGFVLARAMRRG